MTPPRLHQVHHQQQVTTINGLRPSPLRIKKESHLIHKSSSSSSSSCSTSSSSSLSSVSVMAPGVKQQQHQQQQQQQKNNHPVIIYTQSPKVIHTQARDFMALVQKLTGHSSSTSNNNDHHENREAQDAKLLENDYINEIGGGGGGGGGVSPILKPPNNPCFADIPLFTPNSVDFFCSPRPLIYRFPDSVYASSPNNMANSIPSPSVLEFFKGLPEY